MRGVQDVHSSSNPGDFYRNLIMVGVPAVLLGLFSVGFVRLDSLQSPTTYRIVERLQALDARLFLAPIVRNPITALCVAVLLAYAINLYAVTVDLLKKSDDPSRFKDENSRSNALYVVPPVAGVAGLALFVALTLVAHLDEPPLRYWSCAVLSAALVIAASLGYSWISLRKDPRTVKDIARAPDAFDLEDLSGAARVADLSDLLVISEGWPTALKNRMVIGRLMEDGKPTNRWVAPHIKRINQTMVVAPPGSGKTFSIALPMSRDLPLQGQSVFAVDVKGNMREKLLNDCKKAGVPLYVFDPSDHKNSIHWNPFSAINKQDSVDFHNGRDRLAEAIYGEVSKGDNQYFDLRDLRFIKAGIELLLTLNEAPRLQDLYALFLTQGDILAKIKELDKRASTLKRNKLLTEEDERLLAAVKADLAGLSDKAEQKDFSFSEMIQGVRNKLEPFGQPALRAVTDRNSLSAEAGGPTYTLGSIIGQPSVFLCSTPMSLGYLGSSIAAVMVRMVQHEMTKRFKTAKPDQKLFLILDEFSKLRLHGHQVEDFISTSREAQCVSVVILQDISQLATEIRMSILSNCKDVYILRGAGPATATWFSQVLDTRRRLQASLSENQSSATRSESAGLSASVSEHWVPVLRPREIRAAGGLKYGAWLLLDDYSRKPILVDLNRD